MDAMGNRTHAIESVISEELDRQAREGAIRIDIHAMASAIEGAIGGSEDNYTDREEMDAAKRPSELNSSNDG
jgi:hypothetical protein